MGLQTIAKGQILHKAGNDSVNTIEVLVKGKFKVYDQYSQVVLTVGGLLGITEIPGKEYSFTYEALEDSAVYSYPFNSDEDVEVVIRSNPKIASILSSQASDSVYQFFNAYDKLYDDALAEYEKIKSDYADYPVLCIKAGETPISFEKIDLLIPPERTDKVSEWEFNMVKSLKEQEVNLKKFFYPLNIDICIGVVMLALERCRLIVDASRFIVAYRKQLKRNTTDFTTTMKMINGKLENMASSDSEGGSSDIVIVNALSTIISYSKVAPEIAAKFEDRIHKFKANDNRYDSADEARSLRRKLSSSFYDVFKGAFLHSLEDNDIPIELKMFFMFGFVDEELAGDKNTRILCNMARAYVPDPEGNVLLLYEWLKKVYALEVEPSRNEFDQDWPTYLREQKATGNLNQAQIDAMTDDPLSRLEFEINNLFSLGNRMTFGRISSFVPVFDSMNVLRPLDMAYITASKINEFYSYIRNIDYGVFCRQALYSNPEIGITQLFYAEDVTPYMILMPNIGSRASLWQEIEGKKRSTKARMLVSIFNTENTEECMIKLFGEFRWEMCKTEQGVHWNDVTDPSLTSMYCDYLQFFKKNSSLSPEVKEKLKLDLKKFSNNYKNVFIADYLAYVKYESAGSPRLNKVSREILFTFCPFSKDIRDAIAENPQYRDLINHLASHNSNLSKPLLNLKNKLIRDGIQVPEVLSGQIEYLESR
ncbi:Crp/Fnr family transcriptional regulator [Butyrivibrio sp. XB500-5]|uniref:Crp/Fnr family transcriptional regulator n=1 Tax=Butyrivibrio sp. XB500-5 TaxID=2364880 RepID=UPI000EA9E2E7|nr:Crp/Fnr family transcriptional regulator [Butyrivibrio sp. XB500-5]RKM62695.1 Crp/Fnr family transcriptional regulator [Butyrivibrio sp. XB500-5]